MKVNKTYFKFLMGFLGIIAISVVVLLVTGYFSSTPEVNIDNMAEVVE